MAEHVTVVAMVSFESGNLEHTTTSSLTTPLGRWLKGGSRRERSQLVHVEIMPLIANFLICQTEPYKKGAVQRAAVEAAYHCRYVLMR